MDMLNGIRLFRAGMLYEKLLAMEHGTKDHLQEFYYGTCKKCGRKLNSIEFLERLNKMLVEEHYRPLTLLEYSDLVMNVEAANDEAWKELLR